MTKEQEAPNGGKLEGACFGGGEMPSLLQFVRLSFIVCVALTLAGCVTVSNSLTADDIKSLRYTGTTVSFDPQVAIWWGDGERAYAGSKGLSDAQAADAIKTPEGKAYIHGQIASRVKAAMDRHLPEKLAGTRPVRVDVVVKSMTIPGAAQRIIIGGTYMIGAEINLVDAKSGKVLVSHPGVVAAAATGQGIAGAVVEGMVAQQPGVDRVIDNLAIGYGNWLKNSAT